MFSLALVKFTSFTYVRLSKISVAFITLLVNMLSNSMVSLLPTVSVEDPPPSHPLKLKTCEGSSLLMSNKISLSIVFRAFCVVE